MSLIQPKEITLPTQDGGEVTVILSKFPAVQGREIIAKYPLSAVPKLGDYAVNEETMLKLMSFVAVPRDTGEPLRLTTRALVDNHAGDWETLARIEMAMLEYNVSFFAKGGGSTFWAAVLEKAQGLISKTLTDSLAQLSRQGKPPSTS